MKKYMVIEDNGGGLALVVFAQDEETIEYIHFGYEYVPGELLEDLRQIKEGADPAEEWEGNDLYSVDEMENPERLESWFPLDEMVNGWDVVADNDGIYLKNMGASASKEFRRNDEIPVEYRSGQSRNGESVVDYMLTWIDDVELYAEAEPVEGDETGTYDELRAEIIRQAEENGIDTEKLRFWLD